MYFEVLGPLVVRTDAGDPVTVPDTKVRTLLLDLLVHRGRPVSADRLIDDLWGDQPPRNAIGTLQARVSQLRTALERAEPGGRSLITHGPGGYTLQVAEDVVDSNEFERLRADGSLAAALELWRGPAYADIADLEFARATRDRLEELRLTTIEELLDTRLNRGDEVLGELAELVSRHPLRERVRAIQLRALYRAGRQDEALRAYAKLRETLSDELGADPGPELVALHQAILRHDPALSARSSTLPTPLNDLIGRDEAVPQARHLLETARLVTLVGPGGVGKTRLALETARDHAAYWVELAAVGPDDVLEVVAEAVGLRDDSADLAERLAQALRTRPGLLVLDNCEHLLEPVAELVGRLLADVPALRVLTTSREPLGLAGEHLLEVPPLEEDAAAELFTARASAAAGVVDDPATVAAICRRLDGIPLALELAATRVRSLGLKNLAAKLDDRFRLLAGGRGVPERQRTLRATIDWSWALLTEDERTMLRRLAVHADSFSQDAAEEISGLPAGELVGRLVDRSLVVPDGDRYRLLESVAAYSLARLDEAGETSRFRTKHAAYYVALAERAEPHLRGPGQREWLNRLDQESANLRIALQHATPQLALRLVNAAAWYWYLRGRLGEGRRALATALDLSTPTASRASAVVWQAGFSATAEDSRNLTESSEQALALFDDLDDPLGKARAQWFLTMTQWAYGERDLLAKRIDEAIGTFTRLDDRWGLAAALSTRAELAITYADPAGMVHDGRRSLELFEQLGDDWGRLQANYALIVAAEISGDYPTATARLQEALQLAEELGMWTEVSFRTSGLGRIALLTGDYQRAVELHERARRIAIEHSNKSAEEYAEVGLGLIARRQGRLDEAERHLTKWLDWLRQVGGTAGIAFLLAQFGFIAEQRGDHAKALELHRQGLDTATAMGDERAIALALEGLAGAKAAAALANRSADDAADLSHEAAVLLDRAEALRRTVGVPLPPGERFDVDRIAAAISRARR